MSWLKNNIINPVLSVLLGGGYTLGNTGFGFGTDPDSRTLLSDSVVTAQPDSAETVEVIRQLTASLQDSRDPYAALPVIYSGPVDLYDRTASGRETGLILADISVSGALNEFLHLTYWITYGPIQGLDIFDPGFGSSTITNKTPETGTLFSWRFTDIASYYSEYIYNDYGKIFVHNGNPLATATPDWHADTRLYPGIAHIKITLELPDSGEPTPPYTSLPNWTWHVYGINPTNLVSEDTGLTRSRNALYLYDYLTNGVYGRGLDPRDLDTASFLHVYGIEQQITWTGSESSVAIQPYVHSTRYIAGDTSVGDSVVKLLGEMQCSLAFKRGRFYLKPHPNLLSLSSNYASSVLSYPDLAVYTLTEQNTVGGLVFNPPPSDTQLTEIKISAIEHRRFLETQDTINYYTPANRQYQSQLTAEQRFDRSANYQYHTPPTNSESNSLLFASYMPTVQFTATGNLINADPYDLITINHRHYPALKDFYFVITDIRLNMDMSVSVIATGALYNRGTARTNLGILLYEEELFAEQQLNKYVYDIPSAPVAEYGQFELQEANLDRYRFQRYRTDYVPGSPVNPYTGQTETANSFTSMSATSVARGVSCESRDLVVQVTATTSLPIASPYTVWIRSYTTAGVPTQTLSNTEPFLAPMGNEGFLVFPGNNRSTFTAYLTLDANTNYRIEGYIYNNNTGALLDTILLNHTTVNTSLFSETIYGYHVTSPARELGFSQTSAGIDTIINQCLGGTWELGYYIYDTGVDFRTTTINLPATLSAARSQPALVVFDNTDFCTGDFDSKRFYSVFKNSSGTTIHTSNQLWDRIQNYREHRRYGYAQSSTYTLDPVARELLERLGRTDLVYN